MMMVSQVQRSAEAGSRNCGRVQPRVCFHMRNMCSLSKRRKNIRQHRSTSTVVAPTPDHHSHTGLFTPPLGR
jgi:hypothetical protein